MQRCEITGVGIITGNQISHSHRLSRRAWRPNLQLTTITVNGTAVRVKVCPKALKTLKGLNESETIKFLRANSATLSSKVAKALNKYSFQKACLFLFFVSDFIEYKKKPLRAFFILSAFQISAIFKSFFRCMTEIIL